MLPDLGDGYVQACLEACNMNPEEVIHRVFEGSLPESVLKLDRSMPLQISASHYAMGPEHGPSVGSVGSSVPGGSSAHGGAKGSSAGGNASDSSGKGSSAGGSASGSSAGAGVAGALASRRNIYDGDSLDIFSRGAIDPSLVHIKGVTGSADALAVLDDHSSRGATNRQIVELAEQMLYDDEYDDALDEGNVRLGIESRGGNDAEESLTSSGDEGEDGGVGGAGKGKLGKGCWMVLG